MSVSVRAQLLLFLLSLSSIVARSRFIEEDDGTDGLYSLLSMDQKRQSEDFIFRRPLIISLELYDVSIDCTAGDFIKVGSRPTRSPQIAPTQHPPRHRDRGEQEIFDGWVLKGEKFPSRQDHPLPLHQRYTDYCSSEGAGATSRSSQNVAMVFFRIHSPDSGFTLAVKKLHNPFRECSL
ncbi:hypothetical protein fugu_003648 [Takifugu bimaculatus]|uniref:Corticotropin-releasing factor binding protein N-terminal domain-containing protein n=1 Tax=Takifugu bimaculatus TaxID=433685 RepID=A0A4Z2BAF7_9TELE|nr:hypothetical protein fugu_003648 [Takifugu bimaculatus]